jgi:transposase-like protein
MEKVAIVLQDDLTSIGIVKGGAMARKHATDKQVSSQEALIDSEGFIRGIVQATLQEFLEAEMVTHLGAEPYERTEERTGLRNGYKPRVLNLTVGSVSLRLPQARDGGFHTELFERYQRSERAFTLAIVEMWLNGVSSRKVAGITDALSSVTFSKSTVSELCKSLDAHVNAWRSRDLSAHTYPYLFVDALYEDVRVGSGVVSEGVLIACGVRDDGKREILDVAIADTESAAAYNDLFGSLKERGASGVLLVTSDAHSGLKSAIKRYFQGASWQRCQVHFIRDAALKVSLKRRSELCGDLSSIFNETERGAALTKATEIADKWRETAPRVAAMLDDDIEQCLSALSFPEEHQVHIRTNNFIERLNEEIRRRDRVIGVFPNEASLLRLVCSLCIERSELWTLGRPYLDMSLLDVDDVPLPIRIGQGKLYEVRKAS